jgi:hypothetical protein
MLPIFSKPSSAAPTSLVYITIGALLTVWSAIWFLYLRQHPPAHEFVNYVDLGMLLSGVVVVVIGFKVGPMGRMARQAELPPSEVTPPSTQVTQNPQPVQRV